MAEKIAEIITTVKKLLTALKKNKLKIKAAYLFSHICSLLRRGKNDGIRLNATRIHKNTEYKKRGTKKLKSMYIPLIRLCDARKLFDHHGHNEYNSEKSKS
ncbi:MAG: hypothetical protein ACMUIP_06345 [bacterium]